MSLKFRERINSRKFALTAAVMCVTAAVVVIPAVVNYLSGTQIQLISGSEYVSLMLGALAVYSGANVFQKSRDRSDSE